MYIGRGRKRRATIAAFLAPTVVGFLLFSLIPIARSLYLSFTSWDILQPAEWVGLENYKVLLGSEEFWRVMRNTGEYIVLYVPLMLVSSLALAALLNRKFAGVDVYKVLFFLPVLTSWVAGSLIWRWILNHKYGLVNILLGHIGVAGPAWLDDKYWAMPGIVLASVWKDAGFFALIFLGALKGINHEYYEAAQIDGASPWNKFRHITLPLVSPTTFFVTITSIINSFQVFAQVQIMTYGGPAGATQVIMERIYKYAFQFFKMGYASALSWVLFVIILIITAIQWRLQKGWVFYDG
ncbi:MAG TPA: sugar ABC transporter permease [Bacillota bacterium]|jgi:multiple sugar transport system permease protein|nr:sugar ABC transporter permease [Bacillota bacterium]HNU93516.1 sugar ABC transporter permease [Bacillota bacterium]HOI36360.1 sugar ABC transporter permease [Bacillota bacterium]HPU75114.1 sugar ABC transporter permease [Bacillota bacterium]